MNIRLLNRVGAGLFAGVITLALAVPAAADPALWVARGPHATVYLFGTSHFLKKTTEWRSPKIQAAFAASGTLLEELKSVDDVATAQPLLAKYGQDPEHPLSSKLDDAGKAKLAAVEAAFGLPPAQLEPLRPWFAAQNLALVPIMKAGYDPRSGVDLVLKTMATEQHKPIEGFETIEQQIRFMADLPQKLEVDFLLSVLDDASEGATHLDQMVDAWLAGDTVELHTLFNSNFTERYPQLYQVLIVQRNRAFAHKIEALLKGDGVVFVAVGQGHLVGPDSVQADLAADGIQTVRQ